MTLIREYIIKHQDIKNYLQQSYQNIALGSKVFILIIIKIVKIKNRDTSYTISPTAVDSPPTLQS